MAKKTRISVDLGVRGGNHAAIPGGNDLAGVKRETGHIASRLADSLPATLPLDVAPNRTGSIFNYGDNASTTDRDDSG
jgi:hypothetical protein